MVVSASLKSACAIAFVGSGLVLTTGCQAPMARPQDFSILNKNSHRADVIAVLGKPVEQSRDIDDTIIDSMQVAHGRGAGARAAVGTARWVGGIATLGLTEAAFKDVPPEPVSFKVYYNKDLLIRAVTPSNDRAVKVFRQQGINSSTAAAPSSTGTVAPRPPAHSGRPDAGPP